MTDTARETAQARAVLSARPAAPTVRLLGAVHKGLQSVPAEAPTTSPDAEDDGPRLVVRRRTGH